MRVLVASHYASERLGGEAAIPLRLIDRLQERGIDSWLVTHDSDRDELTERFADRPDRLILTKSLPGLGWVFRTGERLPDGPRAVAWGITQLERQLAMRSTVRRAVGRIGIDVVHQPIGIAPGIPSALTGLSAPLVIGPLNGGMQMPPGISDRDTAATRLVQRLRRPIGTAGHSVLRGKLEAAAVLVANDRTRALLPPTARARARWMPESAVVLSSWPPKEEPATTGPPRFIYVGRFVDYKAPDLIVEAFARIADELDAHLDLLGDGPLRERIEAAARGFGVADRVRLLGWTPRDVASKLLREADVFVHPSLREPGGTAVLEAMASGLPSIVADWGGPGEYITDDTGVRVSVASRDTLVTGVADAMRRLGTDPQLRARMGAAARQRVARTYEWNVLTDQLVELYEHLAHGRGSDNGEAS